MIAHPPKSSSIHGPTGDFSPGPARQVPLGGGQGSDAVELSEWV